MEPKLDREVWRHQSNRSFKDDQGAVERWKAMTPAVLQEAIRAGWEGSASPAQRRLLTSWVTARVHGTSLASLDLLLAHLGSAPHSSYTPTPDNTHGGYSPTTPD